MNNAIGERERKPGYRLCILECGCAWFYGMPYPQRGETVICPQHRGYRVITNAPPFYRTKCKGDRRGCSVGRGYGVLHGAALQAMAKHLRSRPSHTMELYDGKVLVETQGVGTGQTELVSRELLLDPPPF